MQRTLQIALTLSVVALVASAPAHASTRSGLRTPSVAKRIVVTAFAAGLALSPIHALAAGWAPATASVTGLAGVTLKPGVSRIEFEGAKIDVNGGGPVVDAPNKTLRMQAMTQPESGPFFAGGKPFFYERTTAGFTVWAAKSNPRGTGVCKTEKLFSYDPVTRMVTPASSKI